jgi:hypothetical protein
LGGGDAVGLRVGAEVARADTSGALPWNSMAYARWTSQSSLRPESWTSVT